MIVSLALVLWNTWCRRSLTHFHLVLDDLLMSVCVCFVLDAGSTFLCYIIAALCSQ